MSRMAVTPPAYSFWSGENPMPTEEGVVLIHGRGELAKFLTEKGFRIRKGTLDKLARDGKGPPDEGNWGRAKAFLPSKALAWAQDRLSGLYGRTRVAPVKAGAAPVTNRTEPKEDMPPEPRAVPVDLVEMMPPEYGVPRAEWATSENARAEASPQRLLVVDDDDLPPF
jgi:hypothetical protein